MFGFHEKKTRQKTGFNVSVIVPGNVIAVLTRPLYASALGPEASLALILR